jgi:hypothetical protein
MVAVAALLLPATALAFPPAPHHTLYGMVRDQFGTPLTSTDTQILLQTPGGAQLTTAISPNLEAGVNYQLEVPMDAGNTTDLYESNALTTAASFKLHVIIGTTTNTPIQMLNSYAQLGKPSKQTRMDLFLGQDVNGDGLPDAWEYAILAALGMPPDLSLITPGGIGRNGMSYLGNFIAGTYPFDPNGALTIRLIAVQGDAPVIEFQAISGRTYTVLGSPDLKQWTPLSFQIPADGPAALTRPNIYATGVQKLQVQVIQPAGGPEMHYFRLLVQ